MTNEHDWTTYHRLYRQAVNLEKSGAEKAAIKIYRDIVENYWPIGAEYYRRPARLLERAGNLEDALMFTRFAILNHIHLDGPEKAAIMDEFVPWLKRLLGELGWDEKILYLPGSSTIEK